MPRPYTRRKNVRRGDARVALDQQPRMRREGEAMPRPYTRRRNLRTGDACVALDREPRKRREAEPGLPLTHEEGPFVRATHASPSISSRACGERARHASPL